MQYHADMHRLKSDLQVALIQSIAMSVVSDALNEVAQELGATPAERRVAGALKRRALKLMESAADVAVDAAGQVPDGLTGNTREAPRG